MGLLKKQIRSLPAGLLSLSELQNIAVSPITAVHKAPAPDFETAAFSEMKSQPFEV